MIIYASTSFSLYVAPLPKDAIKSIADETPLQAA
jgi:hypothetical protein